jgi:hypothetical protein
MLRSLKLMLIALLFQYGGYCIAQASAEQYKINEAELKNSATLTDTRIATANQYMDGDKQDKKGEVKKGPVKQVKSARPDMSKSRGARPPDIVRPSGSRIPKGVGRPAGAGRHGRG